MLLNTNNFNDISDFINSLSFVDFEKIVKKYSSTNNVNFNKQMENMVTLSLESKLNKLHINSNCPSCNSNLKVKNGKRSNVIQEYKCKECNTKFTAFTGTILEKTKWHYEI